MDVLDILRRQAGRFQCPKCGKSMVDCGLEMIVQHDQQSLVKVTCAHCQDTRLIAVAVQTEAEPKVPTVDHRDEPAEELGPAISTDDVLDVQLALSEFDGDIKSLLH